MGEAVHCRYHPCLAPVQNMCLRYLMLLWKADGSGRAFASSIWNSSQT